MPEPGTGPARAVDADVPGRFSTIQSAIDAAVDGDTITVAPGRYEGAISFRGKDVVVRSTSGPAVTILAADLGKGPVVTFSGEETSGAVLQGFTIQGFFGGTGSLKSAVKIGAGGAPVIRDNLFLENRRCGAIDASSADPEIRDNVFMGNMSFYCSAGIGGVITRGGTIEGNTLIGNHGYGIRTRSGVVTHNVLVYNFAAPGMATGDLVTSGGTVIDNLLVQESGATQSAVGGRVLHNTFVVGQTGIRFGEGLIQGNVIWRAPGDATALVACVATSPFSDNAFTGGPLDMNCVGAGNLGSGVAFESAARFDYRPAAGSAQVDLVPVLPDVSEDLSGAPRPVDGDGDGTALSDAGAHEVGAGSPLGTITGRAVDYAHGTGARGVCVLAFGDKGTVRAGRTTTAGYYRIERLQPDTYRLLWRPCTGHTGAIWVGGSSFSTATRLVVTAGATVAVDFPAFTPAFIRLPSGDRSEEGFADHPGLCFEAISTTRDESFIEFLDLDARYASSQLIVPAGSYRVFHWDCARGQVPFGFLGGGITFDTAQIIWTEEGPNDSQYTLPFVLGAAIAGKVGDPSGYAQRRVAVTVTDGNGYGLLTADTGAGGKYFLGGVAGGYSSLKIRFDGPASLFKTLWFDNKASLETADRFEVENGYLYTLDVRLTPLVRCEKRLATRVGSDRNETINGTTGPDVIVGLGGNDTIDGRGGNDVICGGLGRDTLRGADGDDHLLGEGGADFLDGGPGTDVLKGGPGTDTCINGETPVSC